MHVRIAGIILRADSREETARFYSKLGLSLQEHAHGGPVHYESTDISEKYVFEIYQKPESYSADALMFVYIIDPDKRRVMLMEQIK